MIVLVILNVLLTCLYTCLLVDLSPLEAEINVRRECLGERRLGVPERSKTNLHVDQHKSQSLKFMVSRHVGDNPGSRPFYLRVQGSLETETSFFLS